jgi:CheY-like chemotaxis protein/HPt (histidine-containing phosphotransfer) domain-containing protein
MGACIAVDFEGEARIMVDSSKCVACGSCLDVCEHGARDFRDDTDRFFRDLNRGEKISLLLAPAFKANYPQQYDSVLGGLRELGVNRIISVSFGADITTWGYLNYIKKYDFVGGISQPCPAAVGYIERYLPELIPKIFPVQSPLMCAAIYARKKMGITDKLAFISPCIAKKMEIDSSHNKDLVQYNVTFEHLMDYVEKHDISGPSVRSEIEYGMGSFYPTPGGLAENVKWFLGDQTYIRQIEGEKRLYEWLHQNEDRLKQGTTPFLFIDALNCEKGCICGTAVDPHKSRTDDALYALLDIREESKKDESGSAWSVPDSPEERLASFNKQFEDLDLNDFLRGYTDRSADCRYEIPDDEQLDEIFKSMNKLTEESRMINCTSCGYESCREMAVAIHNGFNNRKNCIFYEKVKVHSLEIEKAIAEGESKAKSRFLAKMSHEIRTPINAVLGMDELILRDASDGKILEYAQSIKDAGRDLLNLVNTLLDFKDADEAQNEDTGDLGQSFTAPEARVLVVDDTEINLSIMVDLLKPTQIRTDTAGSADEALKLMDENVYDVLLFDHMMPEKDGIELLHEIRAKKDNPNSSKPALVLTANAVAGARGEYLAAGFDGYMSKPIDDILLGQMLLKHLPSNLVTLSDEKKSRPADIVIPPEYASLEGIDAGEGIKNCGSVQSYKPILDIFYNSIIPKSEELDRCFAAGDWKLYTIGVHALKSSARIVGAQDLSDKAFALEMAGKDNVIDYIKNYHEDLMTDYRNFRTVLHDLCEVRKVSDDRDKKPADADIISKLYREIYDSADAFDYDGIEEALEEADRYKMPEEDEKIFDELRNSFDIVDYEKITDLLGTKV